MWRLFVVAALLAVSSAQETKLDVVKPSDYENCAPLPKALGAIHQLRISGCPSTPCKLKKGTFAEVEVDFEVAKPVKGLKTEVFGSVAGIDVKYTGVDSNACASVVDKGSTTPSCDADKGLGPKKLYTYKQKLEIKKAYPPIPVSVKWTLLDGENNDVFCFLLPARVVN